MTVAIQNIMKTRLGAFNARRAMARIGVEAIRNNPELLPKVTTVTPENPRGFYSGIINLGHSIVETQCRSAWASSFVRDYAIIAQVISDDFNATHQVDQLFGPLDTATTHQLLGLKVNVYPGINNLEKLDNLFPELRDKFNATRVLLEKNFQTPAGQPSPVRLPEDNPKWVSEIPDIRNIRGNLAGSVADAKGEAETIAAEVDEKYGTGTMNKIKNILVMGIGANDMYQKDLPMLNNADSSRKRNLYSVFDPKGLINLPAELTPENTLLVAISRGGGTEETIKTLAFNQLTRKFKYLVSFANRPENPQKHNLLAEYTDQLGGLVHSIPAYIGGRYMLAKGKIVLVPFALTASEDAWKEYTQAMIDFDNQFWPVGSDNTILDMARHLFMFSHIYNIPGFFAASNHPVLEAGLRIPLQLHNEAVGKVINNALMFSAGMPMLPFAHAGADGLLGRAIGAGDYGFFIFDTSTKEDQLALTEEILLPQQKSHAGLTVDLLEKACVFPNWAKFSYAGGPNMMIEVNKISFRNTALLTAMWQNLMYPYLIANGTNPDSNFNVATVRTTTGGLITETCARIDEDPMQVIADTIPKIMK